MDEPIEVQPSAENGNVSVETEPTTPSVEPTEPVAPTEPTGDQDTPVEPELFELPDGRKVDALTLSKEWKENFYPDYTRKSQALKARDEALTKTEPTKPASPLDDPNWQPQSYAELASAIRESDRIERQKEEEARLDKERAVETEVVTQLENIKKQDPNVNENALFQHALKYHFQSLEVAYQNMKDMNLLVKSTVVKTAKDIAKRNDPVSTGGGTGNGGAKPDPSRFESAREFLRSL